MPWNWQQPDWPNFNWQKDRFNQAEQQFLLTAGQNQGTFKHLRHEDQDRIAVESMSTEALTTSEIEGEILDRASVQSSIQKQLGLAADKRRAALAERGVSEMMVSLYKTFATPLSDEMLYEWHR